jgi:DNA helicase-2/ATP-dependent DNA helicase PcrA
VNHLLLGRSLVISSPDGIDEPWQDVPSFVVDEDLLANPVKLEALVTRLHEMWTRREPYVIQLFCDPDELRSPEHILLSPWELGGGFSFLRERLQFLVWRNSYDARSGTLIWWWGRKALELGADAGTIADIVLDGADAWVDGGPRGTAGDTPTINAESIELGELVLEPLVKTAHAATDLDEGQAKAVLAALSTARIVAPAGSGKTRTMVARARHLVGERGVQPTLITVLAYNKKAQEELVERLGEDARGLNVRTFHSLAFAIVKAAVANPLAVMNEGEVRGILSSIARTTPRANVDPIAPFIEAATEVRLGLIPPAEVELARDDVPDFPNVFQEFRERMQARRSLDFEEMVYRAIEVLLNQPQERARWQAVCRHVLVDEFQDLTPAFLLLLRLVASPGLQVFAVGDDDQTIYGYIGADPGYLVDYQDLFPGAALHSLDTNYRCPVPVVTAAKHLLTHNNSRVTKIINPGPNAVSADDSFAVRLFDHDEIAYAAAQQVKSWLAEGVPQSEIAVLTRVNTGLLPVVAALRSLDVAIHVEVPAFAGRTAVAAALSWLRLGLDPDQMDRADLMRAVRRPRAGLVREAEQRLESYRTLSIHTLRSLGSALSGRKAAAWDGWCDNISLVSRSVGDTTQQALEVILHTLGLSEAAELLDKRRTAASSAHGDDLVALERLAALHPDPVTFDSWLADQAKAKSTPEGVRLATIHKVKGAEWSKVLLFGVDHNALPHRLADDREEERRILHVGITRGKEQVVILSNKQAPSPFLDELTQDAALRSKSAPRQRRAKGGLSVQIGDKVRMSGGYEAAISQIDDDGALVQLVGSAASVRLHWGQHISLLSGRSGPLTKSTGAGDSPADSELAERIKDWRRATATQKGLPAFVILHDSSIDELASKKPTTERGLLEITGIGPAKIEAYGEDLLDLVGG